MIRMSKLADYAFVLLTHMAHSDKQIWSASGLADQTTLPQPTVAKLMKILAKHGITSAQRGAGGGYRIAKPPQDITVADVIEAVDGPVTLTSCLGKRSRRCAAVTFCSLQEGWDRVNQAMRSALQVVSLADMTKHVDHAPTGTVIQMNAPGAMPSPSRKEDEDKPMAQAAE